MRKMARKRSNSAPMLVAYDLVLTEYCMPGMDGPRCSADFGSVIKPALKYVLSEGAPRIISGSRL